MRKRYSDFNRNKLAEKHIIFVKNNIEEKVGDTNEQKT